MHSAHLIVGGQRVASVEIATTRRERGRGLLGREGFEGALVLPGVRSVHTVGMRFAIDVAFARWNEPDGSVLGAGAPRAPDTAMATILDVVTMKPHRVGRIRRCDFIVETKRGALAGWGIARGSLITIVGNGNPNGG